MTRTHISSWEQAYQGQFYNTKNYGTLYTSCTSFCKTETLYSETWILYIGHVHTLCLWSLISILWSFPHTHHLEEDNANMDTHKAACTEHWLQVQMLSLAFSICWSPVNPSTSTHVTVGLQLRIKSRPCPMTTAATWCQNQDQCDTLGWSWFWLLVGLPNSINSYMKHHH